MEDKYKLSKRDHPVIEDIIKYLSKKYKVTYDQAERVFKSQFQCIRDNIQKVDKEDPSTYFTVRLPEIGRWQPKTALLKNTENYDKCREIREEEEHTEDNVLGKEDR